MNNTEQFDEWIRGEMDSLDSSPENFRQGDIWQKLQTELHAVPEKKTSFFTGIGTHLRAFDYRIAAAVALLLLVGGTWWKVAPIADPIAVDQAIAKIQTVPPLKKKQSLLAAGHLLKKEEVSKKRHLLSHKQSKEKLPEASLSRVLNLPETHKNVGTKNVGKVLNGRRQALADVPPATVSEIPIAVTVAQSPEIILPAPTEPLAAKTAPKPRFKIIHANELADYRKTEMAQAREKEAKAKGFIVINWKANATDPSESTLTSYFKNKPSKAD